MNNLFCLKPLIGEERTLVVTCLECFINFGDNEDQVFTLTTLGNILNPNNDIQRESIRHYVDAEHCSKIIVVGHFHCRGINYILNCISPSSSIIPLRSTLQNIMRDNYGQMIRGSEQENVLPMLNVIHQCKQLMEYFFIQEKLRKGSLTIMGVIITPLGQHMKLFYNGFSFNDPISSN